MTSQDDGRGATGFTLVEVLTVIVIVGVLAAIAVPVFLNQRRKAHDAALRADMHNVAAAYATWQVDHPGQTFPDAWWQWGTAGTSNTVLADLNVRLSGRTQTHSFDLGLYYPATGYPPGHVYCIEMVAPDGSPGIKYYSSGKGGQIGGACQVHG